MIGLGTWFILQGTFSIGGLMAYRGYWWQLFSPIHTIAQINEMFQRANAAAARVFELLDEPVDIIDRPDAISIEHITGHVAFHEVSFAYATGRTVLEHIDVSVPAGNSLGIVGPSGAGKSTLLNMLLRFYDPSSGRVTVDGHNLKDVQQISLRSHCALVSQEAFLFNDSIINNIRYGRFDATDAEVFEAARLANAHEFIKDCANGYDTVLGERGVKLSGGERQRLCIARAFLANPRILLLDEATSAVEPESEHLIQVALKRLMEGRTCIIISHRLSMVRDCNQIIVVKDGHIQERGTHQELMSGDDWYAEMYNLQMGNHAETA
jgi:subfamily B ATP-binding cassette protein MsbA